MAVQVCRIMTKEEPRQKPGLPHWYWCQIPIDLSIGDPALNGRGDDVDASGASADLNVCTTPGTRMRHSRSYTADSTRRHRGNTTGRSHRTLGELYAEVGDGLTGRRRR